MTKHQRRTVVLFLPLVLLLAVADASAQDKGKIGIAMGYPASIGFVAHVSDRLAIRPELSLSMATSESETSSTGSLSSDNYSVTVGLSALWYLGSTDKLRPYVSPQYSFGRSGGSSESLFGGESESTGTSHLIAGSFGAQYSLHDRFSLFGEIGVAHVFSSRGLGTSDLRSKSRVTGTRSGAGVIFYF